MAEEFKTEHSEGAPFNMALKCLEKVHNILTNIAKISVGVSINDDGTLLEEGKAQHVKYRLVRQLYIQSVPLFNKTEKNWKDETNKKIRELKNKLSFIKIVDENKKVIKHREGYNYDLDDELDDLTIEISEKLQEENYFMPPKSDPRFGWKQS